MSAKTLTVEVTLAHIMEGVRTDGHNCPIAIALRDHRVTDVFVDEDYVTCRVDGEFYRSDAPLSVKAFVGDFDGFKPVSPFTFTIALNQNA